MNTMSVQYGRKGNLQVKALILFFSNGSSLH
eukprot:UN05533